MTLSRPFNTVFTYFFTGLFTLVLMSCSSSKPPVSRSQNNHFVLNNINILDIEHRRVIHHQRLLIRNGKIEAITSASEPMNHSNLRVIEGLGGYVTPGLVDMHVHMYEAGALSLALSHGVTHVRIMNGMPAQLVWRDKVNNGELIGSSASVSSPIISGNENAMLQHYVDSPQSALNAVQQYKSQGYDLIKAYGGLSAEVLKALIEEANRLNMPIAKHGPHGALPSAPHSHQSHSLQSHYPVLGENSLTTLAGLQSFEHVEDIYQGPMRHQFSQEGLPEVIQALSATNVPITPTLNIFDQLTQISVGKHAYLSTIPESYTSDIIAMEAKRNQVKRWLTASDNMGKHNQKTLALLIDITHALHQHNIPLMVGSDSGVLLSPHGIATHREMQLLKQAGLDNYEVLKAATLTPAKALLLEKQIGKIEAHFNADFIYTYTNPIQDINALKHPIAVAKNGHWYTQKQLSELRDDAINNRSFWREMLDLLEAI